VGQEQQNVAHLSKRRLLQYLGIADLTELPVSRYAQTTALLEDKRDRATLDPATYRLKTMLALFKSAKKHQPNWKEGPPRSAAQAALEREWWALERDELLAAGEFAEQLNRQNIGDQDKVTRLEKFLKQLKQQNADRRARLERKQKHADEREHLDYIRNSIRQGVEGHRLAPVLAREMDSLDSIVGRLSEALFVYEEIRLWLQTRLDLAAEIGVSPDHEVEPDDLRYMLESALFVGTFVPPEIARGFADWITKQQEQRRAAHARAGREAKRAQAGQLTYQQIDDKIINRMKPMWESDKRLSAQELINKDSVRHKHDPLPAKGLLKRVSRMKKAWAAETTD
jgi:hypothetical protein